MSGMVSAAKSSSVKSEIDDVEMMRYLTGPHSHYSSEKMKVFDGDSKNDTDVDDGDALPFEV